MYGYNVINIVSGKLTSSNEIIKILKLISKNKEEKKIRVFDFDDTLSLSHWDKEIDWWVHDGPHDEMIQRFNNFKEKGYIIYIVTSIPLKAIVGV